MSNPLGPGTRNVTANVPTDLYIKLNSLATTVSGVKLGAYLRALMEYAVQHRLVVQENSEDRERWVEAIRNGESPLPKVRLEVVSPKETLRVADETPRPGRTRYVKG